MLKPLAFPTWIKEMYEMNEKQFKKKPQEIKMSIWRHYQMYMEVFYETRKEIESSKLHDEVSQNA